MKEDERKGVHKCITCRLKTKDYICWKYQNIGETREDKILLPRFCTYSSEPKTYCDLLNSSNLLKYKPDLNLHESSSIVEVVEQALTWGHFHRTSSKPIRSRILTYCIVSWIWPLVKWSRCVSETGSCNCVFVTKK